MNKQQKLVSWAQNELVRMNNAIIEDGQGGYLVFAKYYLKPNQNFVTVSDWSKKINDFSNRKVAISWCVADKVNYLNLANQIMTLDQTKQCLQSEIERGQLRNQNIKNTEFDEIVNTKLEPKIVKYRAVSRELEKCINWAKYIQIKGFDNETARIHGL